MPALVVTRLAWKRETESVSLVNYMLVELKNAGTVRALLSTRLWGNERTHAKSFLPECV